MGRKRRRSDEEIRAGLVKAYQDIMEKENQKIEELKDVLSSPKSSPIVLLDAAVNLSYHNRWKAAALGLIEDLYFEILGEKFGGVDLLNLNLFEEENND